MTLSVVSGSPTGIHSFWPELSSGGSERRCAAPSAGEITRMDQTYGWCGLIPEVDQRRLVLMRSLVWPDSPANAPRNRYSWRELRRITGLHGDTLKLRWGQGIDMIVN